MLGWGLPFDGRGYIASSISLFVSGASSPLRLGYNALPACDATWHHVAVTCSQLDGLVHFFLDGSRNMSIPSVVVLPPAASSVLRVGWSGDPAAPTGPSFAGALSDLRIYARALSAAELVALSQPPLAALPHAVVAPAAPTAGAAAYTWSCVVPALGPQVTVARGAADGTWGPWPPAARCGLCPASAYTYFLPPNATNATGCARCAAGARFVAPTASCAPAIAPTDTAFYLSGSQAEGASAFALARADGAGGAAMLAFEADHLGAANGAMSLAGSSYLFADGAGAPAVLPTGTGVGFSVAAWVRCSGAGGPAAVFTWGAPGVPTGTGPVNSIALVVAKNASNSSGGITLLPIAIPACDGAWRHAALTVAPPPLGTLSTYLDGALVRSAAATVALPPAAASTLRVGWSGDASSGASSPFAGALSDLRVYARALSAEDVRGLAGPQSAAPPGGSSAPDVANEVYVASGAQFWRPRVFYSGHAGGNPNASLQGLVHGEAKGELPPASVLAASDEAVEVLMPPFEGTVWLCVAFSSDFGDSTPVTEWVPVVADAPVITSIVAAELDDPCLALQTRQLNRNCPGNTTALLNASLVHDWGSYALPPNTSCFDATHTPFIGATTLLVRGRNFGSGLLQETSITVFDAWGDSYSCSVSVGSSVLLLGEESVARCILQDKLVSGNATLTIATAFRTATSTDAGINLVGVCPCGMYAIDKRHCQDCPDGASCAGAREPPRALKKHWDRSGLSWKNISTFAALLERSDEAYCLAERNFNATAYELPAFPLCPIQELCLANLNCVTGASGWMCVECDSEYQRDVLGMCRRCDKAETEAIQAVLGLLLTVAALLGLAECCGLRHTARPFLRRAASWLGVRGGREVLLLDRNSAFRENKRALRREVDARFLRLHRAHRLGLGAELALEEQRKTAVPPPERTLPKLQAQERRGCVCGSCGIPNNRFWCAWRLGFLRAKKAARAAFSAQSQTSRVARLSAAAWLPRQAVRCCPKCCAAYFPYRTSDSPSPRPSAPLPCLSRQSSGSQTSTGGCTSSAASLPPWQRPCSPFCCRWAPPRSPRPPSAARLGCPSTREPRALRPSSTQCS